MLAAGTSTTLPGYCDNLPISSEPEACLIAPYSCQVRNPAAENRDQRTEIKGQDCPPLCIFFFALGEVVDWKLIFLFGSASMASRHLSGSFQGHSWDAAWQEPWLQVLVGGALWVVFSEYSLYPAKQIPLGAILCPTSSFSSPDATVGGGWWKSFRVSWWFFFSGLLVASWPLVASFNLVPSKLWLDCFFKNVTIRMASFLSFLLWCRSFLFLCFFGHFRGELIDNAASLCSSCVFWVLFFFFLNRSLVFLHL